MALLPLLLVAALFLAQPLLPALGGGLVAALLVLGLAGRSLPRFGAANAVTLLRLLLCWLLLLALVGAGGVPADPGRIAALAALALALDGIDGWLARRQGMATAFGARFDMETDTLLLAVLSLGAWLLGAAGLWILLAPLLRPAFLLAGRPLPWLAAPLPPSQRRRVCCVLPLLLLILALPPVLLPPGARAPAALAALALLLLSFAIDIHLLRRRRGA